MSRSLVGEAEVQPTRRLRRSERRMAGGASKKTALCVLMAVVASSFSIHGLRTGETPNTGVRAEAGTTITLEAPNNWTQSGSSFGPAWQQEMALFKATTGITVKSDVLPLASFTQVESTQLAAGPFGDTAFEPDLASGGAARFRQRLADAALPSSHVRGPIDGFERSAHDDSAIGELRRG